MQICFPRFCHLKRPDWNKKKKKEKKKQLGKSSSAKFRRIVLVELKYLRRSHFHSQKHSMQLAFFYLCYILPLFSHRMLSQAEWKLNQAPLGLPHPGRFFENTVFINSPRGNGLLRSLDFTQLFSRGLRERQWLAEACSSWKLGFSAFKGYLFWNKARGCVRVTLAIVLGCWDFRKWRLLLDGIGATWKPISPWSQNAHRKSKCLSGMR